VSSYADAVYVNMLGCESRRLRIFEFLAADNGPQMSRVTTSFAAAIKIMLRASTRAAS
jgi:hypothetical protein